MEKLRTSTGQQRARLIEECRRTVGASSVALCRVSRNGELTIIHLAGQSPDAAAIEAIIACASTRSRSRQPFSILRRRESSDLALVGSGSNIVSAILPAGAEPWAEHVIQFVAERLVHSAIKPSASGRLSTLTASSLVLPSEMVVGTSVAMRELLQQMSATVSSGIDVLLSGETGTGKELLAHIVHNSCPTRSGPFVAINCAAIPGELLEAELFGVERRVATGVDPRTGLFIEADRGSIFLDEIAELPDRLQAKLLRVLQEREVLAVGASRPRRISVRIISASNQDLSRLVTEGRFRADLYYRLRGLEFHLPPLRDRAEDIPAMALEFLVRTAEEYGRDIAGMSNTAIEFLQQYTWPGNIRELQTEIRRAVLVCPNGQSLQKEHFGFLTRTVVRDIPRMIEPPEGDGKVTGQTAAVLLRERLAAIERIEIDSAMRNAGGNRSHAARLLGITRNGLAHKLRRLGLAYSKPRRSDPELCTNAK
jgi:transcriptional regulator with PAS, ATPase and Fis domain